MPPELKDENIKNYTSPCREMTVEEILRQRARELRERSARYEKLADEISRFSFSEDSHRELRNAICALQ